MSVITYSHNLLWLEWITFSSMVLLFGVIVLRCREGLPNVIHRIVKYGKSANVQVNSAIYKFEIPKRYFYHFYVFALTMYTSLAISAIRIYFSTTPAAPSTTTTTTSQPSPFNWLLDNLVGKSRHATVAPESAMIGLILLIIQVTRRLCECTMLSVYSEVRMNIIHYIFGYSFYFGVGMSMVAEAPGFTSSDISSSLASSWSRPDNYKFFTPCHMIGVVLFLYSSYIQFESHQILANLRKDKNGKVVTHQHSIPRGRWFELVSCPHYMAEILIYLSISIVLAGQSRTWWLVFLFVVVNQLVVGKFNHDWYIRKFDNYPKSRRAVIPFVKWL